MHHKYAHVLCRVSNSEGVAWEVMQHPLNYSRTTVIRYMHTFWMKTLKSSSAWPRLTLDCFPFQVRHVLKNKKRIYSPLIIALAWHFSFPWPWPCFILLKINQHSEWQTFSTPGSRTFLFCENKLFTSRLKEPHISSPAALIKAVQRSCARRFMFVI